MLSSIPCCISIWNSPACPFLSFLLDKRCHPRCTRLTTRFSLSLRNKHDLDSLQSFCLSGCTCNLTVSLPCLIIIFISLPSICLHVCQIIDIHCRCCRFTARIRSTFRICPLPILPKTVFPAPVVSSLCLLSSSQGSLR